MQADLKAMLQYRFRHELRRAWIARGSMRARMAFIALFCSFPLMPWWFWKLCNFLLDTIGGAAVSPAASSSNAIILSFLIGGLLLLVSAGPELFREVGFAPEQWAIQVSPVEAAAQIRYRLAAALIRTGPFQIAWSLFPLAFIHRFIAPVPQQWAWSVLWLACCVWINLFSLRFSVLLHGLADRRGISRHYAFVPLFAACVAAGVFAAHSLFHSRIWIVVVSRPAVPSWLWWGVVIAVICTVPVIYRSTLAHWPGVAPAPAARRRSAYGPNGRMFSRRPGQAVFQKDWKDLTRNPAYRVPVLLSLLCLPFGLWAQWSAASTSNPASGRRMLLAGSLLYLVPLFISARTVSLELRMLDLYRLVLPHAGKLLDIKWRFQAVLNVTLVATLAFPVFSFLRGGVIPYEPLFFAAAAAFGAPVLTMLALALGAFFPVRESRANPVGMSRWGAAAYFLLALVLFSLLVNGMITATAIYLVFLSAVSGILFHFARCKLK